MILIVCLLIISFVSFFYDFFFFTSAAPLYLIRNREMEWNVVKGTIKSVLRQRLTLTHFSHFTHLIYKARSPP